MDAHTRELARAVVDMGLVGDLSGARVRDELVALLSERTIGPALHRLRDLGLDAALHPAVDCGEAVAGRIARLDAAVDGHAPGVERWRLRLAAMAHRLPGDVVVAWLERLRIRRRDARVVSAVTAVAPRLADRLAEPEDAATIGALLDAQPIEVAVAIAADEREAPRAAAELYLGRLRELRLDVSGDDLRDQLGMAESPRVGEVLDELLRRRRNGELGGREEQLAAARELIAEVPS
jgi:hypothetical protein